MLKFESIPENDKDIQPEIHMSWNVDQDLDIYEFTEKFKDFLKSLTFPQELTDRIQVLSENEMEELGYKEKKENYEQVEKTVKQW